MTDTAPVNGNGLTGADMLALVAHITGLLSEMEGRIMDRLTENTLGAETRWIKHDTLAREQLGAIHEEIGVVRSDFNAHVAIANAHFAKEHDEEVRTNARVRPVMTFAQLVAKNWKSIALAIFALMGILGWAGLETHVAGQ